MIFFFCISVCEPGIHFIPKTDFVLWRDSSTSECADGNQATTQVKYSPMSVADDTFLGNFLNILTNRTELGKIFQKSVRQIQWLSIWSHIWKIHTNCIWKIYINFYR